MQERLENHWLGRSLISSLIVVLCFAIVLPNLPRSSHLGASQRSVTRPLTDLTGLHQGWSLFDNVVGVRTRHFHVDVHYSDGSTKRWDLPHEGKWLFTYRAFRWRKMAGRVWESPSRRAGFADWLQRTADHDGKEPVALVFVLRASKTPPMGSGEPREWQEEHYRVTLEGGRVEAQP